MLEELRGTQESLTGTSSLYEQMKAELERLHHELSGNEDVLAGLNGKVDTDRCIIRRLPLGPAHPAPQDPLPR